MLRATSLERVLRALVTLGIFALPVAASAGDSASVPVGPKWDPWVEFGGFWGSDDSSHGVGELWAPLMQGPTSLFFLDARFQLFEEDVQEGNLALGLRKMTPSGWNLGIWGGLDVRSTTVDNTFWQLSGGLEALSVKWDLRVNGYVPTTDPQASPELAEVKLKGNNIFMIGGEEVALYGFDGEIGYLLFGSPQTKPGRRHELRVYGGGFWFDHSDAIHEVAGPKARIEWRIDDVIANWAGSRLTFETEYSNDEVRDDRWEVGLRLRIPFGGKERAYAGLTPQERRMTERIERDNIITTQSDKEKVEDALTDVNFDRVAFVNDGGSITTTSANAGGNSLIIAKGGTVTGPQELQGNQTLQGGGSTIQVRGLKSGTVADFTAPGSRPTLFNDDDSAVLTLLGSNTHVTGLDIVGAGQGSGLDNNHGIFGDSDLDNMFISDVEITEVGGIGIFFRFDNEVSIADAKISNTGQQGIQFRDGNTVTIASTQISNTGQSGIFINSFNRVTITGTAISDTEFDGLHLDSFNTAKIADLEISNTGTHGIRLEEDNKVSIADTKISNTGEDGIKFDDRNTVTIAGTEISETVGQGIDFRDANTVKVAGTTISETGNDGIFFMDGNTVTIAGTEINNTGDDGIFFFDGNTVTIASTVISNIDDGIGFFDGNTVTIANSQISNAGGDGIFFAAGNTVSLNNSNFSGTFGDDVIDIDAAGNTLSGGGNVFDGTVVDQFCEVTGAQTGNFAFDQAPQPTCP